jgi:hypothetical protein
MGVASTTIGGIVGIKVVQLDGRKMDFATAWSGLWRGVQHDRHRPRYFWPGWDPTARLARQDRRDVVFEFPKPSRW